MVSQSLLSQNLALTQELSRILVQAPIPQQTALSFMPAKISEYNVGNAAKFCCQIRYSLVCSGLCMPLRLTVGKHFYTGALIIDPFTPPVVAFPVWFFSFQMNLSFTS